MRSHLLEGKVRHRRAVRSSTTSSTTSGTSRSTSRSSTRSTDACAWSAATAAAPVDVPRCATTSRCPATDLPRDIRAHLRAEGVAPEGWRVTLVTNLRVLGYVFNPASFFLCRDARGTLRVVVVEVHNTFGERHLYTLRRREGATDGLSWLAWIRPSSSRRSST